MVELSDIDLQLSKKIVAIVRMGIHCTELALMILR